MLRFVCECGRQLQAREEDIGKKAKCPSCGAITTVPAEDQTRPHRPDVPLERADRETVRREDDRPRRYEDRDRDRDRDDRDWDRDRDRRRSRSAGAPTVTSGKAGWALGLG